MKLKLVGTVAACVLLTACKTSFNGELADGNAIPGSYAELQQKVKNHAYFALNSSSLDHQAQGNLDQVADWSKQNPDTALTVEGHCDPRGTREYNLQLGERRAVAAKKHLAARGAAGSINTVSYGKDRLPAGPGADEESYALNRVAIVNPS